MVRHQHIKLFLILLVPRIQAAYSNQSENSGTQRYANTTGPTPFASAGQRPPGISTCAPQHTVDEGETLVNIWKRCCPRDFRDSGYSWRTICDENRHIQARQVECGILEPGDKIKLPSQCNAVWTNFTPEWEPTAKQANSTGLCAENITVQPGDTLFQIASRCCSLQETVPDAEFSNFWTLTRQICEYNSNNRQAYDNLTLTERDPECASLMPKTERAGPDIIRLPPQCVKSNWGADESEQLKAPCRPPLNASQVVEDTFKPCHASDIASNWQQDLLCRCDVHMVATCINVPDGMPDFSIAVEPNSVAMGSQVVTVGNVSAQQSFTYEFASGSSTQIRMDRVSTKGANLNLNLAGIQGASFGISGSVSLTNSTMCGTSEDNKVANTNSFQFPAGQCWGVMGFARAKAMPEFQFKVMAEVHVKAKVNGTVCPPVHTLWAHGLDRSIPVYSSMDCDGPSSKVYILLKGTATRKLMVQSLMMAYRCDREVNLAERFKHLGFCTSCLRSGTTQKDGPPIERFSTAPLLSPQECRSPQGAGQTNDNLSPTESRCNSANARKVRRHTVLVVWWLWLTALLW